ncbi:hypothetical protein [Paenibacillus sp. Marseille-Q4541]|uniref:hypothetical protein n=1 Tax=Paenibacillus sp. Marseille-Q4541 TaxID=2831522 RepID=UPI001BA687C1|nr:hypothetical protein [Paenibacillus sp. Marseille-Q4541]
MIKSTVIYLLRTYFRSSSYFLPCFLYFLLTVLIYSYKPNPIADSYSVTAAFLFFFSCWIGRGVYHAENPDQRAITITHSRNKWKFYLSEWFSAIAVTFILAVVTILFPVLMNMFERFPDRGEWITALVGHFSLGILGSSLALLTQRSFIHKTIYGLNLLLIWSLAALLHTQLISLLPENMKCISWILPPVLPIIQSMIQSDSVASVLVLSGFATVYAIILASCYIYFSSRKNDVML